MEWQKRGFIIFLILCFGSTGIFLCGQGFFSIDNISPENTNDVHHETSSISLEQHFGQNSTRLYDRLVFLVIDALRADMVLGKKAFHSKESMNDLSMNMPHTRNLFETRQAQGYVGFASVPTVTMPRLKALTIGKIPAFIDVVRNFNSAASSEDNLIKRFHEAGYRMVFYGDDTWLKLFPDLFQRNDGTSGFFTKDTIEVDNNITRHLNQELDPQMRHSKSKDWDVLILHYLGLDHVGHLRGPRSELMKDKLHEMDNIIHQIDQSIKAQDIIRKKSNHLTTLFLLCSDHGMTEQGNHGGASIEESSALIAFMNIPPKNQSLSQLIPIRPQVDLVPTLAYFFGVSIPTLNTGKIVEDALFFLKQTKPHQYYLALYQNCIQLWKRVQLQGSQDFLKKLHPEYNNLLGQYNVIFHSKDVLNRNKKIKEMDIENRLLFLLHQLQNELQGNNEYDEWSILGAILCFFISSGVSWILFYDIITLNTFNTFILIGCIIQLVSLGSSSSIENEHATWFYLSSIYCFMELIVLVKQYFYSLKIKSNSSSFVLRCKFICIFLGWIILRWIRNRNEVINFSRLNHLESSKNDNTIAIISTSKLFSMSIQTIFFNIWIVLSMKYYILSRLFHQSINVQGYCSYLVLFIGLMLTAYHGKNDEEDDLTKTLESQNRLAHWIYFCCLFLLCIGGLDRKNNYSLMVLNFENAIIVLCCLLQRANNLPSLILIILLSILYSIYILLNLIDLNINVTTTIHHKNIIIKATIICYWFGQCAFFALGNSHVIATIDISKSYTGLEGFAQTLVGLLTCISTFTGPILFYIPLVQFSSILCKHEKKSIGYIFSQLGGILISYQLFSIAVYSIIVFFMRFHLFIWSVFAPKLLYLMTSTVLCVTFISIIIIILTLSFNFNPDYSKGLPTPKRLHSFKKNIPING